MDMGKKFSSKSRKVKEMAREHVIELFEEARKEFRIDKKMADKCVEKARKIAMKYKLRMPRGLKRRFCKHCYSYLVPGKNLRVRMHEGHVVYYCLECKKFMRFPYVKEQKKKRKYSGGHK